LKFSNTYKAALALSLATSAIVVSMPTANAITFKDVESLGTSQYALALKDSIYSLANRGIVNGKTSTEFAPMAQITRAEVAKMIVKALDISTNNVVNPNYKDVKTTDWYYPYIAVLSNMKILNGYGGDIVKPNNPITRGEMAKLLVVAFELKASSSSHPFTDVPKNHFSNEYIAALFEHQITTGLSATKFGYNDNIKRGDVAIFITKIEKLLANSSPVETNLKTVTLNANDYGFKSFNNSLFDNSGVYKKEASSSLIKVEALKEGQGKVLLKGVSNSTSKEAEAFYLVNVETINNQLQVALEKADLYEYIDYRSVYYGYSDLGIGFTPAIATLKNAAGEVVNEQGDIYLDENGLDITMFELGKFHLTLENGSKQKTITIEVELKNFETRIDLY
jgi:hypothetical protein